MKYVLALIVSLTITPVLAADERNDSITVTAPILRDKARETKEQRAPSDLYTTPQPVFKEKAHEDEGHS